MKHNFPFSAKIIVSLSIISIISITTNIYQYLNPREVLIENKLSKKEQNNLISMMLETENGKYEESKDNTWPSDKYKLNEELSGCENGSEIIWDKETKSIKVSATSSDKCYAYFDYLTLSEYIKGLYTIDGENNLYYHDGQGNYTNSNLEAGDFSYRYSGSSESVNNYICFGGECSNDVADPGYKNLYRIIGLFKNNADQYEMKIIKADLATEKELGDKTYENSAFNSYGTTTNTPTYRGKITRIARYHWNSTDSDHLTADNNTNVNMWASSNLNTTNLNVIFYNGIDEKYRGMIVEHIWQVGGYASNNVNVKATYDYELGSNKLTESSNTCYTQGNLNNARQCNLENDLTYKANVGLIYLSDYMYGTLPNYWATTAYNYQNEDVTKNNWIYLGLYEWAITRNSGSANAARSLNQAGNGDTSYAVINYQNVRPVVYLSEDVKISGGSGTENEPYKIAIN